MEFLLTVKNPSSTKNLTPVLYSIKDGAIIELGKESLDVSNDKDVIANHFSLFNNNGILELYNSSENFGTFIKAPVGVYSSFDLKQKDSIFIGETKLFFGSSQKELWRCSILNKSNEIIKVISINYLTEYEVTHDEINKDDNKISQIHGKIKVTKDTLEVMSIDPKGIWVSITEIRNLPSNPCEFLIGSLTRVEIETFSYIDPNQIFRPASSQRLENFIEELYES